MGFDAYATRNGEVIWLSCSASQTCSRIDSHLESIREAFCAANAKLFEMTGSNGLEDASISGKAMLMRAISSLSILCYDSNNQRGELYWTPVQVLEVHSKANWNFEPSVYEDQGLDFYFYWQTRLFLQTCAEQELGIFFSW